MLFRRTQPLDFRVELSPLIDVVFLLLIFFMVSTSFVEEAALEIQLPESGSSTELAREPIELLVKAEGTVILQDREVDLDELRRGIRQILEAEEGRPVLLKADRDTRHGAMVRVYDALREAGAAGFVIDAVPAPKKDTEDATGPEP